MQKVEDGLKQMSLDMKAGVDDTKNVSGDGDVGGTLEVSTSFQQLGTPSDATSSQQLNPATNNTNDQQNGTMSESKAINASIEGPSSAGSVNGSTVNH